MKKNADHLTNYLSLLDAIHQSIKDIDADIVHKSEELSWWNDMMELDRIVLEKNRKLIKLTKKTSSLKRVASIIRAQLKKTNLFVRNLTLTPYLITKLRDAGIGLNSFVWEDVGSYLRLMTPSYIEQKLHQLFNKISVGAIYGIGRDGEWFLLLETLGSYDVYISKKPNVPLYKNLSLDRAIRLLPRNNYVLYFIPTKEQILEEPIYDENEDVENLPSLTGFISQGRNCDNCDSSLKDDDFDRPGSWSYRCPSCGFRYVHGGRTPEEQVEKFQKNN